MGRRKNTGNFIDEQQLLSLWEQWKNSSMKLNLRKIPEQLVYMMYVVADHLLEHQRFVRYPQHMKDDMRQEAVLKCIKNLKNFNPQKGKLFSYFTTCCWTAFVVYLSIHYKEMNTKHELILETMAKIQNEGDITGQSQTPQFKQLMEDLRRMLVANTKTEEYDEKLDSCEKI